MDQRGVLLLKLKEHLENASKVINALMALSVSEDGVIDENEKKLISDKKED